MSLPCNLFRKLRKRDVDVDSCRSYRNDRGDFLHWLGRLENVFDQPSVDEPCPGVYSVLLASLQQLRSISGSDDAGYSHFSGDDGRVTSGPAVVRDDGSRDFHIGDPVRVRHPRHEYVFVLHQAPSLLRHRVDFRSTRMQTTARGETLDYHDAVYHM